MTPKNSFRLSKLTTIRKEKYDTEKNNSISYTRRFRHVGKTEGNAIAGNAPFFDFLTKQYPFCTLSASGADVGLPRGQMGNSEVGHLNIGAGRVVFQDLPRINNSINDGSFLKIRS